MFWVGNFAYSVVNLGLYFLDVYTDVILCVTFYDNGHFAWFAVMATCIALPYLVVWLGTGVYLTKEQEWKWLLLVPSGWPGRVHGSVRSAAHAERGPPGISPADDPAALHLLSLRWEHGKLLGHYAGSRGRHGPVPDCKLHVDRVPRCPSVL